MVSINLPQVGILSGRDEDKFWVLLDERLELCREALMCRHNALKGVRSDVSPIHWPVSYTHLDRRRKAAGAETSFHSFITRFPYRLLTSPPVFCTIFDLALTFLQT